MNKMIDYETLTEITITTQEELDMIPPEFKGQIYIKSSKQIIIRNNYHSNVVAWENSNVVALENSNVVAWGNSSVVAWENSNVVARENSSVEAWENSSVEAWENSSVEAQGNAQIADRTFNGKIKISGNSRIVYMPKNTNDFINFYGVKHTKTKAIFYKAVHKTDKEDIFRSDYLNSFLYHVGETV